VDDRAYILLGVLLVIIAIGMSFVRRSNDRVRIRSHIEARGGELVSVGDGGGQRIYDVVYVDRTGSRRRAKCHTTGWIGVFFQDDRIIESSESSQQPGAANANVSLVQLLEDENRKLRAEIARLRNELNRNQDGIKE
jgi:hypothetical protein